MKSTGQYYKQRSKDFFVKQGYAVDYCERLNRIFLKDKNKIIWVKKDLFGADLIAMRIDEIIFINSKFGHSNIAAGIKEMARFPYPPFVRRVLAVWEKGDHAPEIVDVAEAQNFDPK
jgi:hypothetical protein